MLNNLAVQLDCPNVNLDSYNWDNRSSKRFRQEIRLLLGDRKASIDDSQKLIAWLIQDVLPQAPTLPQVTEQAYQFCAKHQFEPFKLAQLDRYIASACHRFEQQFFLSILKQLSIDTMSSIGDLLTIDDDNEIQEKASSEIAEGKVNDKEGEVRTPSQSEGLDGYEQPKRLPLLIKILLVHQSLDHQVALDS